jgi:Spy/CpxP family protein refolding chaperone
MKRLMTRVVFASMLVVGLAAAGMAQPPAGMPPQGQGGPGMGHGGMMGPMAKLNLTDAQKQQVQAIHKEERATMQADAQKMRDLHQQLRAAIFGDNGPDQNTIATLKTQLAAAQMAMFDHMIATQEKVAGVLTPEQRKQMREMPAGMGMGHEMMRHGGGPKK